MSEECSICRRVFVSVSGLRRHLMGTHRLRYNGRGRRPTEFSTEEAGRARSIIQRGQRHRRPLTEEWDLDDDMTAVFPDLSSAAGEPAFQPPVDHPAVAVDLQLPEGLTLSIIADQVMTTPPASTASMRAALLAAAPGASPDAEAVLDIVLRTMVALTSRLAGDLVVVMALLQQQDPSGVSTSAAVLALMGGLLRRPE